MLLLDSTRSDTFLLESICWIDVCQKNGNLLALGDRGMNKNVMIYDKRESKIIRTFEDIHTSNILMCSLIIPTSNAYIVGAINCVRWNSSGDLLASASFDKTIALVDFKTGKKLYTGKTSDGSKLLLLH